MKQFTVLALLLINCWLLVSVDAKPKESKTVLQFEASPSTTSANVTLPFIEPFLPWNNDNWLDGLNKNCFILSKSKLNSNSIYVRFKFDSSDRERKLFRFDNSDVQSVQFCLDQFIYLNRMIDYQLILSVGGVIDQPFEVKLVQIDADFTLIQEPGQANLTNGWQFLNRAFDYSIEVLSHKLSTVDKITDNDAAFQACDIIANCFAYQKSTMGNKVVYTLDKRDLETLLNTTPFIRIQSDLISLVDKEKMELRDDKYELSYNDAYSEAISQIESNFPNSRTFPQNNSFTFTRNVTQSSDKIQIQIPFSSLDLRFMEVHTSASILSGNNSYLKLVDLKNQPNGFHWENPGINSDNEFSISSRDFFTVGAADYETVEVLAKQNLVFEFQVNFDHGFDELEVEFTIQVRSVLLSFKSSLPLFGSFPKPLEHPTLWPYQNELQLTDFSYVRNRSNESDWFSLNQLSYNLSHVPFNANKTITPSTFHVHRLIAGSSGQFFQLTPLELKFNADQTVAQYDDKILYRDFPLVEQFFKIGYFVERGNVSLDELVKGNFNQQTVFFDNENCKRKPTFAQLSCQKEKFVCPAYFIWDSIQESCKLVNHS